MAAGDELGTAMGMSGAAEMVSRAGTSQWQGNSSWWSCHKPRNGSCFPLQELPQPLLSQQRCHLPSPSQSWDYSGDLSLVRANIPLGTLSVGRDTSHSLSSPVCFQGMNVVVS